MGEYPEPLGVLLMLGNFLLTANPLLYKEILIYAYKKRKTVQIRRGRATVTDATRHNVTAFCGKTRQNGVRSQETPCMLWNTTVSRSDSDAGIAFSGILRRFLR